MPVEPDALLYNARTGAVLRFSDRDATLLARALAGKRVEIPDDCLPPELCQQLFAGGFLVPIGTDEVAEIRERFRAARSGTPMVLTVTTTMDCNLGCYYCYEERSHAQLEIRDVDAIVALTEERLARSGKRALHVDWYGGEPLMNLEFMEAASQALQALCERRGVHYVASIISNGTCWPDDIRAFVARHRIRQVQISFDGLRQHHDRRRRYRREYLPEGDASSFDRAVGLVDRLLDHVRVDVRLNIDRANQGDVVPFIQFARARGWFARRYQAVIQPARLASFSEHSSFMRKSELTIPEFDALRAQAREAVGGEARVEEAETPNGFPMPRTSVCAALADDSIVVGADRRQYRCGLQVSEPWRAVGALSEALQLLMPDREEEERWWQQFDPTELPTCSRCSFLPICWGGCPKKHLERDTHAIAEQGAYWRKNLPRLIAMGVDAMVANDFAFTEVDQFRCD